MQKVAVFSVAALSCALLCAAPVSLSWKNVFDQIVPETASQGTSIASDVLWGGWCFRSDAPLTYAPGFLLLFK